MNAMLLGSSQRTAIAPKFMQLAQFGFRSGFMNPYKHDPTQVDEKLREN